MNINGSEPNYESIQTKFNNLENALNKNKTNRSVDQSVGKLSLEILKQLSKLNSKLNQEQIKTLQDKVKKLETDSKQGKPKKGIFSLAKRCASYALSKLKSKITEKGVSLMKNVPVRYEEKEFGFHDNLRQMSEKLLKLENQSKESIVNSNPAKKPPLNTTRNSISVKSVNALCELEQLSVNDDDIYYFSSTSDPSKTNVVSGKGVKMLQSNEGPLSVLLHKVDNISKVNTGETLQKLKNKEDTVRQLKASIEHEVTKNSLNATMHYHRPKLKELYANDPEIGREFFRWYYGQQTTENQKEKVLNLFNEVSAKHVLSQFQSSAQENSRIFNKYGSQNDFTSAIFSKNNNDFQGNEIFFFPDKDGRFKFLLGKDLKQNPQNRNFHTIRQSEFHALFPDQDQNPSYKLQALVKEPWEKNDRCRCHEFQDESAFRQQYWSKQPQEIEDSEIFFWESNGNKSFVSGENLKKALSKSQDPSTYKEEIEKGLWNSTITVNHDEKKEDYCWQLACKATWQKEARLRAKLTLEQVKNELTTLQKQYTEAKDPYYCLSPHKKTGILEKLTTMTKNFPNDDAWAKLKEAFEKM